MTRRQLFAALVAAPGALKVARVDPRLTRYPMRTYSWYIPIGREALGDWQRDVSGANANRAVA